MPSISPPSPQSGKRPVRSADRDMGQWKSVRRRVNVSRSVTESGGLVWSTPKTRGKSGDRCHFPRRSPTNFGMQGGSAVDRAHAQQPAGSPPRTQTWLSVVVRFWSDLLESVKSSVGCTERQLGWTRSNSELPMIATIVARTSLHPLMPYYISSQVNYSLFVIMQGYNEFQVSTKCR